MKCCRWLWPDSQLTLAWSPNTTGPDTVEEASTALLLKVQDQSVEPDTSALFPAVSQRWQSVTLASSPMTAEPSTLYSVPPWLITTLVSMSLTVLLLVMVSVPEHWTRRPLFMP